MTPPPQPVMIDMRLAMRHDVRFEYILSCESLDFTILCCAIFPSLLLAFVGGCSMRSTTKLCTIQTQWSYAEVGLCKHTFQYITRVGLLFFSVLQVLVVDRLEIRRFP